MRFTLGYQVLLAVILGVAAGIFFGPLCKAVQPISQIYFMLLQMVALPYICVSLIHGLGSMTPSLGKKLLKRGWLFWIALWVIVFGVIYALNLMIPSPKYTTIQAGVDEGAKLARNFLNYLVPDNPIYDLMNNAIPAIASFGLIFGIALMHLKRKEPILSFVEKGTEWIEKILQWLALASPIGIFTHIAVVFGTISFEEIYALAFYIIGFVFACLMITFWILPVLLSSLTPLSYFDVLKAFKTVCLLPFATALPTLALPFIILYMRKLGKKHHAGDPHFEATSQTVLPICYSFGQIGNCMILFFILFLSFFYRHPFTGWEKAILSIFMLPMSFGSSTVSVSSVSFLVDQLEFPSPAIEMFRQATAITMNFQVLVSSASIFSFIVLVLYSYYDALKIQWRRLGLHFSFILAALGSLVIVVKENLHLRDSFQDEYMELSIQEAIPDPVSSKVFFERPLETFTGDPFDRIIHQGVLRVGYSALDIPFSYLNSNGELVGYDIAYAYQLARDLDCTLEFVPIDYDRLEEQLANGEFDIAMSAIAMDEERIKTMNFSQPYQEQNVVLIVPTKQVSSFLNLNEVTQNQNLTIITYGLFTNSGIHHFPNAKVIRIESPKAFEHLLIEQKIDVALWTNLQGFVWCLNHPSFVPIDYGGNLGKCYLAYPVSLNAPQWLSFINQWLTLKEQSGFKDAMTRYWLKAEGIEKLAPRWSILRNVLHWID